MNVDNISSTDLFLTCTEIRHFRRFSLTPELLQGEPGIASGCTIKFVM